ncbi:Carboxylesterase family-domain-containing protein [Dichotomopilus funicola]|uniref:Carboxylesterase family-domain-containing protein n=1 Tax=Dichotomopilus funicola TaxID=1934379 RepID=A0AAN6V208_9PEZI|nr:Carboxylesterase family-domain-containing protein [Dichotomopilus funicola]
MRLTQPPAALVLLAVRAAARSILDKSSSLTLLFQNNLDPLDDGNHVGALLLDPMPYSAGVAACASLHETLVTPDVIGKHPQDFADSLRYLQFSGHVRPNSRFFVANATLSVPVEAGSKPRLEPIKAADGALNVLCTQSERAASADVSSPSASNAVSVTSAAGNTYLGYRNLKSFRFLGIPYANPVSRFEYSTVYSKKGQTINAQGYGANCAQAYDDTSKEDCLFLNIQTPYLPGTAQPRRRSLKPVLLTIHGGAFTGGNGGSGFDGGNLVSREDIVAVSINYRLTTLGFLAIPGTDIKGNFGIGDQVTALRWVRQNIALFGGDPARITVIGESAGAGSVKALIGSPPVIREKLVAGAIAQSNLGGGEGMGPSASYSTTYSKYYTIEQSYAVAGQQIFRGAGCNQTQLDEQIRCLKAVPAKTLANLPDVARYVVQDGHFINARQLNVAARDGSTAHVPVIFGTTAHDGASFFPYPQGGNFTSEADFIAAALGVDAASARAILDSQLFPLYSTGNLSLDAFNVSQRVMTDVGFRCIDEAIVYGGARSGVFPAAYYYTFDRTNGGYDPNGLGATGLSAGPVTPGYPLGNPNLPYFRLHGAEIGFTYGNVLPRDPADTKATQLITGFFASFAKTGDPNPPEAYLRARGYSEALANHRESGPWRPVSSEAGPGKSLDYPARTISLPDRAQCAWLKYPITYYLDQRKS